MKKTLIALLALSGLAMADSVSLTLGTDFTKGSTAGNGYSGISFTVTDDTDRYVIMPDLDGKSLTSTVNLTGISVQFRNDNGTNKIADGLAMVLTDTDHKVLAISSTTNAFETITIGEQSGVINAVCVSFDGVTINTDEQYFAYYVAASTEVNIGNTITAADLASVNLMVRGTGFSSPATDFAVTKGLTLDGVSYTPVGAISVSAELVPEPATATLSLLALAGLAARRKRH